ncbi:MAG: hypothetical protein PWQ84_1958 [Thermotogaceae bacterium]|jgi:predicted nucleotidyltransferase|nr:hypothetical protein [Thermotogaceae bacterium]
MKKIPDEFKNDIEKAIQILKNHGCEKVYLFGSLANETGNRSSDIDLAVEKCPEGMFFAIYAELIMTLEHPVDLIQLKNGDAFSEFLIRENELILVA